MRNVFTTIWTTVKKHPIVAALILIIAVVGIFGRSMAIKEKIVGN